ncbi:hypothetical protein EI555_010671 [Monodon monoceros]|uniref:Uncharacterized protein n=1 Tax=Monodon monoceros TaxID=40151 RepID=A0A4U1ETW6_MONMO|nr:hypothetical protein EI555_010671 [Monodon monoceros]
MAALPHKSEENPGEASASSSRQCHTLQECGPAICAEVCCCHGSLSIAGAPSTPGSFTNRIQAAFRCVLCGYQGLSPALCGHCHPFSTRGAPGRSDVVVLAWGLCACAAPSPVRARGKSGRVSASTGIVKRLKRKSRRLLKKAETPEEFRGLELIATQPEVADGSEGADGLNTFQQLLRKDRGAQSASEGRSDAAAQTTKWGETARVVSKLLLNRRWK